jgi:general secretion pathway protein I
LSPVPRSPTDRPDAGFTMIEVLIALAVIAVSLVAIGTVMSANARGVQTLESHVALRQAAQTILATAIPARKQLAPGTLSGELRNYRWQIDVGPVNGSWIVNDDRVAWIPELVKLHIRSPSGATVDLETVRLMHKPQR